MAAVVQSRMRRARRALFSGQGYIAGEAPDGLVTVNAVPGARYVEVRHRATSRVVDVVFSATDGSYQVYGLDPAQQFDVIGRDWTNVYNDAIVSRVNPEPFV
jgi:hypothetical protein